MFTLKDLKAGKHIVECRDKCAGLVVEDECGELAVLFFDDTYMDLSDQKEDLSYPPDERLSIDAVYQVDTSKFSRLKELNVHLCVWQRKAKKTLTMKELRDIVGEDFEISDEDEE